MLLGNIDVALYIFAILNSWILALMGRRLVIHLAHKKNQPIPRYLKRYALTDQDIALAYLVTAAITSSITI